MRLSWEEIARRARAFSEEWKDAGYEKGETQSFYNEFFEIFGIRRRQVADYERRVKLLDNKQGFIDLFWPRTLLVEQKSSSLNLRKAETQALDYLVGIHPTEQPRYILTCDFQTWVLRDRDSSGDPLTFKLKDLHKHVAEFDFMLGRRVSFETQATVTIKAAELMGKLHDALEESGYVGHELEQFLVRTLFCLFADNTGIFQPKDIFLQFLENDTREDGSDTGSQISELFDILDTPENQRLAGTSDELNAFPYVNGSLFKRRLRIPKFDRKMREHLIVACRHDWSGVSPAIFGSLFQSVMDGEERRAQGAHYTTETNIMKVIGPLFLDELKAELDAIKARKTGRDALLQNYLHKLANLRFFDPACGCGNFLVIAYREIRALELRALKLRYPDGGMNAALMSQVTVDQFYGIEIGEFPAKIAEVAMWMADHLANNWMNEAFNTNYARIPLKGGATILHGDALDADWTSLLPPEQCAYIMGNPPFIGHQWRVSDQQAGMHRIWGLNGQVNRLDYVTAWFKKSVQYGLLNKRIQIAFVATNSICQGEQAGILWPHLFSQGVWITFAHRTFVWTNEARGKAAVHCVIVGMAFQEPKQPIIFDYPNRRSDPIAARVKHINGYLVDGPNVVIPARTQPPSGIPRMLKGSQPTDGARLKNSSGEYVTTSNLILDASEKARASERDPLVSKWLRPFVGGDELISGNWRWCLWLKDADPSEIRSSKEILERQERVRLGRLQSPTRSVREFAKFPALFTQDRQPAGPYVALPEVSSESRDYIPIDFLGSEIIASNKLQIIPEGRLFHFGVLTSAIHMAWVRTVAGRLKSDFSYSPTVYNTFPWPDATEAQRAKIEELAQAVLDARAKWPTSSLADLYDPDTMPPNLRKAHQALDKAIDALYRKTPFADDRDRVEHLFGLYEKMVNPLSGAEAQNKRVARRAKSRKLDP